MLISGSFLRRQTPLDFTDHLKFPDRSLPFHTREKVSPRNVASGLQLVLPIDLDAPP